MMYHRSNIALLGSMSDSVSDLETEPEPENAFKNVWSFSS